MSQLTYEDCMRIQIYLEEKVWSHREIARKLGKSNRTVSEEIKKHSTNGVYVASIAWIMRKTRRALLNALIHTRVPKWSKLDKFIEDKIKEYWSPEQIANKWKRETGETLAVQTVYTHIKKEHEELIKEYFRRHGKAYKYGTITAKFIYNRVSIHERPKEVEDKVELWHREADTIRGKWYKRWLLVLTERVSKYTLAYVLKNKSKEETYEGLCYLLSQLPPELRKSITFDNGTEFVDHFMLKPLYGVDTYFADIWNPWQRGLNENTNGLLRQFFPRNCPKEHVTPERLDWALQLLNNRPRKTLDYLSPIQILDLHCVLLI